MLYASSHRQDRTYHGVFYTNRGTLDEIERRQWIYNVHVCMCVCVRVCVRMCVSVYAIVCVVRNIGTVLLIKLFIH